ncbi:MAG: glycerophosphodiester phosphodiesterase [Oscillospiraceae bacterium]|nr:glycerophosphodiester phosphodiesterase [Oscillospiraceae bacterium]
MHRTTVTAHAGALDTVPNSIESVRACLACGADILEVDVRFLPDGEPALGHNSVGPGGARLEEAFALLGEGDMQINLDMKEKSGIPRMAELVIQYGLQGRAFMTGMHKKHCVAYRDCGIPSYINSAKIDDATEAGALGLNISYKKCTKRLVRKAHEAGLLVSVWTVNRPKDMRKMLRFGADNITTRRPGLLLEIKIHEA